MKILIADDQPRRYERLIKALAKIGVECNSVNIESCANGARDRLQETYYDLLILDILLPLRPESEPEIQSSLDLLFDLHEGNEYHKPERILGITADKDIAGDATVHFETQTWTVVEFSESSDEWINRAINCVSYILNEEKKYTTEQPSYGIDLAIICALEKPELEEVLKLPWNWSSPRPIDDITFVRDGYFYVDNRKITVCATFAPRMGMISTALQSAALISLLRPRLIAMCGICAGVKDKVDYGDVLLADPAWDFQSGKRIRDKENSQFSVAPHQLPTSAKVRTHVQQLRGEHDALKNISSKYLNMPETLNIVIGPVASGSAVLADGEVVKEIKTQHRELIGVEMEIYGMYAAAYSASKPQPQPFALKAVCDFADSVKDDKYQQYAAYTSANVLRLLMEKFGLRLLN
jgi:nucleoside phosphorylase/CheY-like chemotaxis protein